MDAGNVATDGPPQRTFEAAPDAAAEPRLRVLTVGDGDLSFSLALWRCLGHLGIELLASTFNTEEELRQRYHGALEKLEELRAAAPRVLLRHGVDASRLDEAALPGVFDIIVFNYPHCGGDVFETVAGSAEAEEAALRHARRHQALLAHYLASARPLLRNSESQVHVCLSREQPATWRLEQSACRVGYEVLQTSPPTHASSLLCGVHGELAARLVEPKRGQVAKRRWRNGELGDVHWASRWGYMHRRHDGMAAMHVRHSAHYVLVQTASSVPVAESLDGMGCRICGLVFHNPGDLAAHLDGTAPDELSVFNPPARGSKILKQCAEAVREPAAEAADDADWARRDVPLQVTVASEDVPVRLKKFLRACLSLRTALPSSADRDQALRLAGAVLVNGEAVEDSRQLSAGDVVAIVVDVERAFRRRREELTGVNHIEVLFSDGYLAVVLKPAGVRCAKGVSSSEKGTLETALPWILPVLAAVGDGDEALPSPLPVSRLEKGVSGPVVVALTKRALSDLQAAASHGGLQHTFRALLAGATSADVLSTVQRLPTFGEDRADESALRVSAQLADETGVSVDVRTGAFGGHVCRHVCALFRDLGVPVLGDLSREAADARCAGGNLTRQSQKLQIMCIRVDVRLPNRAPLTVEAPELKRFERLRQVVATANFKVNT